MSHNKCTKSLAGSYNITGDSNITRSRTTIYVDCFNLYHHIQKFCKKSQHTYTNNCLHYQCDASPLKWSNVQEMVSCYISDNGNTLNTKLFTAPPIHKDKDTQNRHNIFCTAQKYFGCKIIEGKFLCSNEKQTDTNLVIEVIQDIQDNAVDHIVLLTNDTDFVPLINYMFKNQVRQTLQIITPPNCKTHDELIQSIVMFYDGSTDFYKELKTQQYNKRYKPKKYNKQFVPNFFSKYKINRILEADIIKAKLPNSITLQDGTIITNPYKSR